MDAVKNGQRYEVTENTIYLYTKYEEPTEGAPIPHTRYVINCNESIALRTNPDVNAAEICQIPLGTAVATFVDAVNGFISVYYQGSSGYCLASYLSDPVD